VHPGDLARGCSDLEMTWLLCYAAPPLWVTMVTISGLCSDTQNPQKDRGCTRVSAADTFDHQQFSDGVDGCLNWGEWSGVDLIFIDVGVKINDAYYRDVLLTQ